MIFFQEHASLCFFSAVSLFCVPVSGFLTSAQTRVRRGSLLLVFCEHPDPRPAFAPGVANRTDPLAFSLATLLFLFPLFLLCASIPPGATPVAQSLPSPEGFS